VLEIPGLDFETQPGIQRKNATMQEYVDWLMNSYDK
jgi:hypothetical protein